MAKEQGLYAQIVTIRLKGLYNKKEKDNTKNYNFQGQSTRSIFWFDLDHDGLEGNLVYVNQISIKTLSSKY